MTAPELSEAEAAVVRLLQRVHPPHRQQQRRSVPPLHRLPPTRRGGVVTDPANSYRCETCGACALYKFSENDHETATYNRAYANALRSVSEYLAFHGSEGLADWLIRRERAFQEATA